MLGCSACDFDNRVVDGYATVLGNDDAVRPEALCASYDCAEVVGVGDAVQNDNQKRFAFLSCEVDYILDVAVFEVGDSGNYSLVIASVCELVEHIFVNVAHHGARLFCKFQNAGEHRVEFALLHEYFVHGFSGDICLFDGISSVNVHSFLPNCLCCPQSIRSKRIRGVGCCLSDTKIPAPPQSRLLACIRSFRHALRLFAPCSFLRA